MARIETYPLDGNISVNDYVIGTDGDSLNATKNYKITTFLDYLGRLYNLNSTDLLFNYNKVLPIALSNGEVSTNNYADETALMSDVTNIYVSKITAFGQLVDDIITSIGNEGLTIMFADMGNRNNLGIFNVVSAVDVDANTINLTVTGTTTLGSITNGVVMGIRIGVKEGNNVDLSNYVTLNTSQTITAEKAFTNGITANKMVFSSTAPIAIPSGIGIGTYSNRLLFRDTQSNQPFLFNGDNLSSVHTYTLQNKSGTLAHLDDIATLNKPYREFIQYSSIPNQVGGNYSLFTYGNIKITASSTTFNIIFSQTSSVVGYPILIRLFSTNTDGTTFIFNSGIYDKNGNEGFNVFVSNGEHKSIHFVVAEADSIVATNI